MGLPFNFFGFTELPFILQGSFLFDDDWNLDWRWSGYQTGINGDNYYLSNPSSGVFESEVDPEKYKITWKWSGRFSGVHDEFVRSAARPSGEYTGILTEGAFLTLNWTGSLEKERQDYYHISNPLVEVKYSGILEDFVHLTNNVEEVGLTPVSGEELVTLSNPIEKVQLFGDEHTLEDTYTYSFNMNGIYQKDPSK